MSDEKELGLETLLAVRKELGVDLEAELLNSCFQIQKKYQFSHERVLSVNAMDKLIDKYVAKAISLQNEDGE